jgi:hypothetical protein
MLGQSRAMRYRLIPAFAALLLAPLTSALAAEDEPAATAPTPGWRDVATLQDRARIRGWWATWEKALAAARAAGHGANIDADAALYKADAALPNPHLPPGDYRCRTVKLGAKSPETGLAYVAYPWFACRVAAEQGLFSFAKINGSQRPIGLIFDDNARRQIFLGTLMLGEERTPMNYGDDPHRDMAGLVERIGATRWRIVLPQPAFESLLDVIELVPAG